MNIPQDLRYLRSHEWVRVEGGTAIVGITDFAQDQLGDVVFVELPKVGRTVAQGETVAVVESVKTASDIYSPVSGEITAVNTDLADTPEKVNAGAFSEGWLFKVRLAGEPSGLLGPEEYAQVVAEQNH
jgi:glycine cleavage system H protein